MLHPRQTSLIEYGTLPCRALLRAELASQNTVQPAYVILDILVTAFLKSKRNKLVLTILLFNPL